MLGAHFDVRARVEQQDGLPGSGSSTAIAGRWTPLMRLTKSVAAASSAPVEPAETSASASPAPTAFAAWTIDASGFERTAGPASSPALIVSGASTTSA